MGHRRSKHPPRQSSQAYRAWELLDAILLPYPVGASKFPIRNMEWRLAPLKDLWPPDTLRVDS